MCIKRTRLKSILRKKRIVSQFRKAQDYVLNWYFLFASAALEGSLLWFYDGFVCFL